MDCSPELASLSDADISRVFQARDKLIALRSGELPASLTPAWQIDAGYSRAEHWIPAWSSFQLEQVLDSIVSAPQGCVGDVFRGLWAALGTTKAPLSVSMSNFLIDIVKHCFVSHRALYLAENFGWMCSAVQQGCTEAQAYLSAFALPPAAIANCRNEIAEMLRESSFFGKIKPMLTD